MRDEKGREDAKRPAKEAVSTMLLAQRRSRVKTEKEDSKRARARLQGREYNGGLRTHRETGDDDGEGGEIGREASRVGIVAMS